MYIIIAILVFGILIATHELGHFIAAKACGVKVNEFAVGMGPAIFSTEKGDTVYSLRALPIGGYCAMEGEDEETGDPGSFVSQAAWKKLIILAAGSAMNFITGLIVVMLIFSQYAGFVGNEIVLLENTFPLQGEDGLMPGDKIVAIDGHGVFYAEDFSLYMARSGGKPVDMTIVRDGKKITLEDFPLELREYTSDGVAAVRYGMSFNVIEGTFSSKMNYSFYTAYNFVRNVWMGLSDLFSGRAGIKDMSGPVGIVTVINDVAEQSSNTLDALFNVGYLCAFIAVNLAVMNMLPIPALDGGRIFFLIITSAVTFITKKKIDPKYEGYIHAIGMVLLLCLMAVVMINDIRRLF